MITAAPPTRALRGHESDRSQPYQPVSYVIASAHFAPSSPDQPASVVTVISSEGSSFRMPASLPTTGARAPESRAVIVVASDGEPHPELWPAVETPVLVVLPPHAPPSAVLAVFQAGADACVSTASSGEVKAHLGALLRRDARRSSRSS